MFYGLFKLINICLCHLRLSALRLEKKWWNSADNGLEAQKSTLSQFWKLKKHTLCQSWKLIKGSRVILSEAVDGCICFTQKLQHGGDWERSRPPGPKNVDNFLMTVRPQSWAYGHGTEMLLIVKKTIFELIIPWYIHAVNLWLKPVSASRATRKAPCPAAHTQYSQVWRYSPPPRQ